MRNVYRLLVVVFIFLPSWLLGKLPIDLLILNPDLAYLVDIPIVKWGIFCTMFLAAYCIGYACIVSFPYDTRLNIRRVIGAFAIGFVAWMLSRQIISMTYVHVWNITMLFQRRMIIGLG